MNELQDQPTTRFTLDGSDALESFLAKTCVRARNQILELIPKAVLDGIVLGGGYGRGEGGVLTSPEGEQHPYNDLEFYVFIRGNTWLNQRRYSKPLAALCQDLSRKAGVHVEMKVLSLRKLRSSSASMFYYDLVAGHKVILGDARLWKDCHHHGNAAALPLIEATRLLMNRLSGLLFAHDRLMQKNLSFESHDFVVRNLAKARLALGDAVLTAGGQYHWSCLERQRRLEALRSAPLPQVEAIWRHHRLGVQFKLHPFFTHESRFALIRQWKELRALAKDLWLWIEQQRLGVVFSSIRQYAFATVNKWPESPAWRNLLLNVNSLAGRGLPPPRWARHPGEGLLNALALLLWEDELPGCPVCLRFLQKQLGTRESAYSSLVQAYRAFWSFWN